jgi:hypothetical protein
MRNKASPSHAWCDFRTSRLRLNDEPCVCFEPCPSCSTPRTNIQILLGVKLHSCSHFNWQKVTTIRIYWRQVPLANKMCLITQRIHLVSINQCKYKYILSTDRYCGKHKQQPKAQSNVSPFTLLLRRHASVCGAPAPPRTALLPNRTTTESNTRPAQQNQHFLVIFVCFVCFVTSRSPMTGT